MVVGFEELVELVMKQDPLEKREPKEDQDIWSAFVKMAFLGGNRTDAEINYIIAFLPEDLLTQENVQKTDGEELTEKLKDLFTQEKDEDLEIMIEYLKKDMFRIVASIKGGARYFKKHGLNIAELNRRTKDKKATEEFIEEIVEDEDVTNFRNTKVILWLHSIGKAPDACPPTRHVKDFVNKDIGPYYQFYEDDKYFMEKIEEFAKMQKKGSIRDISKAIFYYRVCKNMVDRQMQKRFAPKSLLSFLKAKKMTLLDIEKKLSFMGTRQALADSLAEWVAKKTK